MAHSSWRFLVVVAGASLTGCGSEAPTAAHDASHAADAGSSPSDAAPATCSGAPHRPGGPDEMGGCWPGPDNTGVPAAVTLTAYSGPCTITAANTVIDGKTVSCDLVIRASNVVIRNSRIEGSVAAENNPDYSFTISDSEVRLGQAGAGGATGIGEANFTALRVEVTGGNRSILCASNCTVRDSWVHGQNITGTVRVHASGIRQSQGSTLLHNAIGCDAENTPAEGGCSAGLTGYGDFEPVRDNRVEKNLFLETTGGACAYGGSSGDDGSKPYGKDAANVRFIDNVFQRGKSGKCGVYFPITDFDSIRPGNAWQNNRWDDGATLPADN